MSTILPPKKAAATAQIWKAASLQSFVPDATKDCSLSTQHSSVRPRFVVKLPPLKPVVFPSSSCWMMIRASFSPLPCWPLQQKTAKTSPDGFQNTRNVFTTASWVSSSQIKQKSGCCKTASATINSELVVQFITQAV